MNLILRLACGLLLLLAGLACSTQVFAQKVTLKGTVVNEDGEPAEYVSVLVNGGQYVGETDANGNYTIFARPKNDTFYMEFLSMNFEERREKVAFTGQQRIELDITLQTKYITSGEVTITDRFSQRIEQSTVSMQVLEAKDVDVFAGNDMRNTIEQIPGVTVNGNQISMRGSSGWSYAVGSRVVVLLNGVPMQTGDRASVDWSAIPVDNIERVEVVKGAASVTYGSGAMGGVINVITKDADKPRTSIRMRMAVWDKPANDSVAWIGRPEDQEGTSDLDEMRTDTNLLNDVNNISYSINLTHSRKIGDNYELQAFADIINDQGHKENLSQRRFRFMVMNRVRSKNLPGLSATLNVQASYDELQDNPIWRNYPEDALRDGFFSNDFQQVRLSVDPGIQFLRNKTLVSYQGRFAMRSLFTNFNNVGYFQSHDVSVSQYLWRDKLNIVAGLNYTPSISRSKDDIANATSHQGGAYVQARLSLLEDDKLTLVLGGRFQFERLTADTSQLELSNGDEPPFSITTLARPVFRAGVNYQLGRATYFRANGGTTVRAPSIAERYTSYAVGGSPLFVIPNADLQLETGWTAELGVRQLFQTSNKRLKGFVDVAGYTLQYNNLIEYYLNATKLIEFIQRNLQDPDRSIEEEAFAFQPQNVASASVYGLEFSSRLDYKFTDDFSASLNLGLTYIEPRDNNGDPNLDGDELSDLVIDAVGD